MNKIIVKKWGEKQKQNHMTTTTQCKTHLCKIKQLLSRKMCSCLFVLFVYLFEWTPAEKISAFARRLTIVASCDLTRKKFAERSVFLMALKSFILSKLDHQMSKSWKRIAAHELQTSSKFDLLKNWVPDCSAQDRISAKFYSIKTCPQVVL